MLKSGLNVLLGISKWYRCPLNPCCFGAYGGFVKALDFWVLVEYIQSNESSVW